MDLGGIAFSTLLIFICVCLHSYLVFFIVLGLEYSGMVSVFRVKSSLWSIVGFFILCVVGCSVSVFEVTCLMPVLRGIGLKSVFMGSIVFPGVGVVRLCPVYIILLFSRLHFSYN